MVLSKQFIREMKQEFGTTSDDHVRMWFKTGAARDYMKRYPSKAGIAESIRIHGKAATALCIAATTFAHKDALCYSDYPWSFEVLDLWKGFPIFGLSCAVIRDEDTAVALNDSAEDLILSTMAEQARMEMIA